ncbi:hypothetical protein ACFL5V_03265 [Fibrobacterota bacterium]
MELKKILLLSGLLFFQLSFPQANEVLNSGFETGPEDSADNWSADAWRMARSVFSLEDTIGTQGVLTRVAAIETPTEQNDARWIQNLNLLPNTNYTVSAWVKGENIAPQAGAAYGACVGVMTGGLSNAEAGTFDWKQIHLNFTSPADGQVTICCRLGKNGSISTGKVWFDDVVVEERPPYDYSTVTGGHIVMQLFTQNVQQSSITPENLSGWVAQLDSCYISMADLVGGTPFNGELITVQSVDYYPGGWAVAGNPIRWDSTYVDNTLNSIQNYGDWSNGIIHEIGHNFVYRFQSSPYPEYSCIFSPFLAYFIQYGLLPYVIFRYFGFLHNVLFHISGFL